MASTTPNDMTQGLTLEQLQKMGAKPATQGLTLQQLQAQQQPAPAPVDNRPLAAKLWDGLVGASQTATNALGLKGATDTLGQNFADIAHPALQAKYGAPATTLEQNIGTGVQLGSA